MRRHRPENDMRPIFHAGTEAMTTFKASLFAAVCLCSGVALAADAPTREHLAPAGWEDSYHGLHYTPVLKVGNRVIVSGIPALQGETDEDKIRWMFAQLKLHL